MTLHTPLRAALALLLVAAATAPPASAESQTRQRFAVFISTLATPQVWTDTGTPQDWVDRGIIDGYLVLDQALLSIYNDFSSVQPYSQQSLITFLNSSDELYLYISRCLRNQNANGNPCSGVTSFGNWADTDLFLVGHHIGGYVARTLGHAIENRLMGSVPGWGTHLGGYPASVTVATVATPNQGLRALKAQTSTQRAAWEASTDQIRDAADTGNWFYGVGWYVDLFEDGAPREIPEVLDTIDDSYHEFAGLSNALGPLNPQSIVGDGGTVPRFVNALSPPSNYISVYGAEKEYVPVRLAPEALAAANFPTTMFGGANNEAGSYALYGQLIDFYDKNRYLWNNCWGIVGGSIGVASGIFTGGVGGVIGGLGGGFVACTLAGYNHKRDRWEDALHELETVDVLWATIVDARKRVTRQGYRYEQVCEPLYDSPLGEDPMFAVAARVLDDPDISADLAPMFRLPYCRSGEDPYQLRPYTYTTYVQEANDGLTGRSYARWSPSSSETQNVATNIGTTAQNGNAYFGADGINGGYNVLELRRSRRAYGRTSDGGSDIGITFNQGDFAPPLQNTVQWWQARLDRNPS